MKNYELTLVMSPELNDEAIRGVLQTLSTFIQEKGGLLEKQEIKSKQTHGILAILAFSLKQEEIENLAKRVKEEKQVLRSMIMVAPKKRAETPSLRSQAQVAQTAQNISKTPEKEEPKMTVEDIDKKLEEIFKDPPAGEASQ